MRLRRRSSPTAAILLLTATLAGVLAYQAWDAARSQRATAEGALRDYAAFAAWEFSISAKEQLYQTLVSIFGPVRHEKPLSRGARPAPPAILAHALTERVLCKDDTPYFFRLDLPQRRMVIHGRHPSDAMQRWIRDTIMADLAKYRKDWSYSTVAGNIAGNPCSIAYQVKWTSDWKPAAAYGFRFCLSSAAEPSFARTMKKARLLPPSLTNDVPNDSLMSVIVRDASGHEVWRTKHQFSKQLAGQSALPYLGGGVVQVSLNPRFAKALVIGGLPQSRLPLLFGILALTMGLAVAGVVQLRREDELARLRGDFIANVSHELRTPLAQLRMFAETLLLGRVRSDAERQRSLEIVDQEARRLSHLVENVLQFSRAERQRLKLCAIEEPLAPHIRAAQELFEPIARARQVRVTMLLDDTIRCAVDPGALRQIMLNLLDNAVKYGPIGQEVRVVLERVPGTAARIAVEDEGPGIPKDHRDKVWEPFYRLDRDADSAVAGSGIGLSVVRELATKLGGSATIESSPRGARVVVELPRCEPNGDGARGSVA